jgi:DNA-binding LacI/PurR family transcriptional regulator
MATSEEVAQYAGVSPATISQAFNASEHVNIETRARV